MKSSTSKTTYDVLNEIEQSGLLTDAIKKDVIPITLPFQKFVYENYLAYVKGGMKSNEAALRVSVENQISKRTVWTIKKKMES